MGQNRTTPLILPSYSSSSKSSPFAASLFTNCHAKEAFASITTASHEPVSAATASPSCHQCHQFANLCHSGNLSSAGHDGCCYLLSASSVLQATALNFLGRAILLCKHLTRMQRAPRVCCDIPLGSNIFCSRSPRRWCRQEQSGLTAAEGSGRFTLANPSG